MAEVRLIDGNKAEAVLRNIADHLKEDGNTDLWPAAYAAADVIKHQPTIDPESLRPKGRWVMTVYTTTSKRGRVISNKKYACSECRYSNGRKQSNYCLDCGAKMEV